MPRSDRPIAFATDAIAALIDAADPYHGLFPSILDRQTGRVPETAPPLIDGQRPGDRSFPGNNLIHDQAALMTAYALADATDRPDLRQGADRYLERFTRHCTQTPTGLFPWGEHAWWHLTEDRVGDSFVDVSGRDHAVDPIHDHLRQAPRWLWEKIVAIEPQALARFGDGLRGHWNQDDRGRYIRHAYINRRDYYGANSARSCDFPRHGGFYILDWTLAWTLAGATHLRDEIVAMLDYWWPLRDARNLLLIESVAPPEADKFYRTNAPGQTLSLAVSLLESAAELETVDAELAGTMRDRAAAYIQGFHAAPHDLENGVFVILSGRDENDVRGAMPIWGSVYGAWPASYVALTALRGYQLCGDPALLAWAVAVGERVMAEPLPATVQAPGMDAGLALGLLVDLHVITGEDRWLTAGYALAADIMTAMGGAAIPCSGIGVDWYDAQMGPSFVIHGLARLGLVDRHGADCPLAADYTAR